MGRVGAWKRVWEFWGQLHFLLQIEKPRRDILRETFVDQNGTTILAKF